ncbi:hypothetical protein QFC22_006262 [Naganishia vaughanmartiniae]|uniref:Uncharacterized protein n=1 Tax=Naganishia vaughanmartiniae TaxID=1424756 RepID=A0ACC2WM18_9TREE|nr:hypothetical protein QFC22_006262 [Naganishia vaughanmartiniae]
MRSSTILSTIAVAALGASAAPAPAEHMEARTLDFLAQAIHTATTTIENWILYPNCIWVGVASNPGYAVYKGWDNNAANINGGQNPGTSLKACEVQCNNLATCTGTVLNNNYCYSKNAVYDAHNFNQNSASVLALKGTCAGQYATGTVPDAMNKACCWS